MTLFSVPHCMTSEMKRRAHLLSRIVSYLTRFRRSYTYKLSSQTQSYAVYVLKSHEYKVEKILKGSLNLIPSPSPSVKIQIIGGKVCLRCKGKTLLGVVNKLLKTKSLLTSPSNVLPYYPK